LVARLADAAPRLDQSALEFVTAFQSANPALIALARSVLEAAEIPFFMKGDGLQDLFGLGRFPGTVNLVTGPVEFQVRLADAEEARALLDDLQEAEPDDTVVGEDHEDDDTADEPGA